jgi:uncharacterized protein YbaA (DUF1428 family)
MPYVDGFLLVVPTKRLPEYRRLARRAGRIWKEHGALEFVECVADDLSARGPASFPRRVGRRRGESVLFSWIRYRSRVHRDRVNRRVLADPRLDAMMRRAPLPFDPRRMSYAGFQSLVAL